MKDFIKGAIGAALIGAIVWFTMALWIVTTVHAHGIHGPNDDHSFIMPQPTKLEVVYDDRGLFGQTCEVYDRNGPCCPGELNPIGDVLAEGDFCIPTGFPINENTQITGGVNSAGGDTRCSIKANGTIECKVAAADLQCASNDMKLTLTPTGSDCYHYKWRGKQQYISSPMVFSPPNHEWNVSLLFVTAAPGEDVNVTGNFLSTGGTFLGTDFKCLNDTDRRECGDANGNGTISVSDAVVVLRNVVSSGSCYLRTCDLDGSHAIRISDALNDLRIVVGLPAPLDCPSQLAFVYNGPTAGAIQFNIEYIGDTIGDCTSDYLFAYDDDQIGNASLALIDLDGIVDGTVIVVCDNLINPDEVIFGFSDIEDPLSNPIIGGVITPILQ